MYLYLKYRFGMTRQQHAVMNVVNGSCGLLVQAFLARALSKRLSNFAVLVLGLSFILMANVMYAVQWALYPWLFFILPVYAVGMLCFPALTALKSNSVANDEQGLINGALSGVRSLGQGLGPLAFNSVLTATQDTRWQSAPFIMGALAAASAIIGALAIPRDQRGPSSAEVAAAAAAASDGAAGADGGSSDAAPPPLPPLIVPPPAASAAYEDGLRDEDELEGFADDDADDDDNDGDDLRDGGDAIINRPGRRVLANRTTEAARDAEAAAMA
jgi:signal transduction histidine kinase